MTHGLQDVARYLGTSRGSIKQHADRLGVGVMLHGRIHMTAQEVAAIAAAIDSDKQARRSRIHAQASRR